MNSDTSPQKPTVTPDPDTIAILSEIAADPGQSPVARKSALTALDRAATKSAKPSKTVARAKLGVKISKPATSVTSAPVATVERKVAQPQTNINARRAQASATFGQRKFRADEPTYGYSVHLSDDLLIQRRLGGCCEVLRMWDAHLRASADALDAKKDRRATFVRLAADIVAGLALEMDEQKTKARTAIIMRALASETDAERRKVLQTVACELARANFLTR
jgi:hypothetical protein